MTPLKFYLKASGCGVGAYEVHCHEIALFLSATLKLQVETLILFVPHDVSQYKSSKHKDSLEEGFYQHLFMKPSKIFV